MNPQHTYDPEARRKGIIFATVSAIVLIAGAIFLYWLSSHGYIAVSANSTQGDVTYSFTNQTSHTVEEAKNTSGSLKKLVRKGTYEVLVKQGSRSYIAYVTAPGFFAKKTVTANLQAERGRTFVGSNPLPCMYLSGAVLVSYTCGGQLTTAQVHVPATAKQPTYIQKNPTKADDVIEGLVKTPLGDVLLTQPSYLDTDEGSPHAATILQSGFGIKNRSNLLDLKDGGHYSIKPLMQGFLVYDASYKEAFYYTSPKTKPTKVVIASPTNNKYTPYLLSTKDEKIAVAYGGDDHNGEVVVQSQNGGQTYRYTLNKRYEFITLCGTNKLCLLNQQLLEIYDISTSTLKPVLTLNNANAINDTKNGLNIVGDKNLVLLNLETLEGSVEYSFGDYTYCGMQSTDSGYLLCIQDTKSKKSALSINVQQTSDEIDKKVAPLLKLAEVKDVTVYDHLIFVSPNAGTAKFQPSLNSYGYDPAKLTDASNKIDQAVAAAGIDLSTYKVINTLKH